MYWDSFVLVYNQKALYDQGLMGVGMTNVHFRLSSPMKK